MRDSYRHPSDPTEIESFRHASDTDLICTSLIEKTLASVLQLSKDRTP